MYKSKYRFTTPKPHHEILPNIGSVAERHEPRELSFDIPYEYRMRHVFLPGMSGSGKSTTFHHHALRDIENGAGVCGIDPKGDLVKSLACFIPPERRDDCIYLDLDTPIPLDFMGYSGRDQKEALIGNLKYIVTKGVSDEHAPLMNAILEDVIYTLLSANENPRIPKDEKATFIDIHDFLEDERRRTFLVSYATPKFQAKWTPEKFPNPKDRRPVICRMSSFVNSDTLSAIFGNPNPKLDIAYCMNNRKILLVDLAGVGHSKMIYGSLLVAKIQQAAFGRHSIPESQRIPFYLYVDEFENFQTSSFHYIISQARGYRLGLTVGCQWLDQLTNENQHALFTVANYIMFGMSPQDANKFKTLIRPYEPDALVTMPPYRALYLVNRANPKILSTPWPAFVPLSRELETADYIRKRTLDLYGCKSEPTQHNSDNESPPPAKEAGRPPVQSRKLEQGHPQRPRKTHLRPDKGPLPPDS